MSAADYGMVSAVFWTRGSGRRLRPTEGDSAETRATKRNAQLLAQYILSCPNANVLGLYYLPFVVILDELGMLREEAERAIALCAEARFAFYDTASQIVWIPNAAEIRIGATMSPKDKRLKWVRQQVSKIGRHRFVDEFMARYGIAYGLSDSPPQEGASEGGDGPLFSSLSLSVLGSSPEGERERGPESTPPPPPAATSGPVLVQTAPPEDIPIDDDLRTRCWKVDAPEPTPAEVRAALESARERGKVSADWKGYIVGWMRKKVRFDAKPTAPDVARAAPNPRGMSPPTRASPTVRELAPPPECDPLRALESMGGA